MNVAPQPTAPSLQPWLQLEQLSAKALSAETEQALLFTIANDTHTLLAYRSALVFTVHHGEPQLANVSGLATIDRTSPYGSWAERTVKTLLPQLSQQQRFSTKDIPLELRAAWDEYWPHTIQLHPLTGSGGQLLGAVLYTTETPWPEATVPMLNALHQMHGVCLQNLRAHKTPLDTLKNWVDGRSLKTRKSLKRIAIGVVVVLCLPIRQFVMAPAEVISLDAIAVTTPVEGIVAEMVAKPNQPVKKGDTLLRLDDTTIRNRLATAQQALEVSRAEFLAGAHRAFVSTERTAESGVLRGHINERQAEVEFLQEQLGMLEIKASRDGIAVYGQENDWIGKPVNAGQRIMELADSQKLGINAWIPVTDAIDTRPGQTIHILLYADPLNPLRATIQNTSYQATKSPDGLAAYRLRATLDPQDTVRLGLRGNAKINGNWVLFGYFVLRKPLGVLRQWLGV